MSERTNPLVVELTADEYGRLARLSERSGKPVAEELQEMVSAWLLRETGDTTPDENGLTLKEEEHVA